MTYRELRPSPGSRSSSKCEVSKHEHCEAQNGSHQHSEHDPVPEPRTRFWQPQHINGKVSLAEVVCMVPMSAGLRCHLKFRKGLCDVSRDSTRSELSNSSPLERSKGLISSRPEEYPQAAIAPMMIWQRNTTYFYALAEWGYCSLLLYVSTRSLAKLSARTEGKEPD